ncbi:hypothetical protein A3C98_00325 [Candidatus Roizmanbacteria bacterium RIFCSPHIGHO2_02_FULL_37_15]|uniref:Uncharacterized protein n=1 Tax=Candidatus Roizmanbacteria bacterium RIFCSPLOWO2_01_FULL_37_16 TaxID=1802058 RepID=A0A1F7IQD5_9BACT|nr:MAG: hypothetical protein A2859_00595 [Candidatus Roizmanbacteria bacterium RIFCSPHIGHO2_01_FULL_37_16b]OGK20348.1 MAG: hypothetical protein A3C98_00325 [Candidatus Roizmanbacteria bacterium RIFCSPHIGHO2_02_FULL_37_15]OGK31712.1 MAG: hypothetical protein A3F57_03925 [Candidatus Roizmanbacteria bacterium RIFCSPHIGHO2_12_FULL_36_11]OGK45564.1 MAG: hypothetical protein A3B40_01170 [Candidatus Roizmanbacteria bacterium RIFCSPLOWO2_01_FULL_37_16]OGK56273.1 MAG: hypothetical protein A3I50_03550 [C
MNNSFTPFSAKLKSNNSFNGHQITTGIKILINIIFGLILFLLGIYSVLTSIYGMKDLFLYTLQLLRPGSWLDFSGRIGIIKDYFVGISGIIIGNLFFFSGIKFIFQKKGGFKLLLLALFILFLNFILAIIYYGVFKFK